MADVLVSSQQLIDRLAAKGSVPTNTSFMLPGGVGYVRLRDFSETSTGRPR